MSPYRCVATGLWLVAWLSACRDALGPPPGAVRFTRPVQFRGWWALTEACSGRTGDFDTVRWYVLPAGSTFQLEGQTVNGAYYPEGAQIVLGSDVQTYGPLVRHEMLHALLPVGVNHPRDQFLDKCGDIVVCQDQCIRDAGGSPDTSTSAPVVPFTALTVSMLLVPNPVSLRADSGWFPITVSVTNHESRAVRVWVPVGVSGYPAPTSFAYVITPGAGGPSTSDGWTELDGSYLAFAPAGTAGATRRLVFDGYPTLRSLAPGEYTVTGTFLGVTSSSSHIEIVP